MRWFVVLLFCMTLDASASSLLVRQSDDPIANDRVFSASGRHCVVMRTYPTIGDFETIRFADLVEEDSTKLTVTLAYYEIENKERTLVSTFELPVMFRSLLLADSGPFIVAFADSRYADEHMIAIFRVDGTPVRVLRAGDVFTEADLLSMILNQLEVGRAIRIDEESERETPVLTLPSALSKREFGEVRIDLARATRRVIPPYPEIGLRARLVGNVWAEVVVSETGDVVSVCRSGLLVFGFDAAVDAAVRQWKFEPYLVNGTPVRVTSEIVFHFQRIEHAEWDEIVESQ